MYAAPALSTTLELILITWSICLIVSGIISVFMFWLASARIFCSYWLEYCSRLAISCAFMFKSYAALII